jgi:trans-aconitate methyltransferase
MQLVDLLENKNKPRRREGAKNSIQDFSSSRLPSRLRGAFDFGCGAGHAEKYLRDRLGVAKALIVFDHRSHPPQSF